MARLDQSLASTSDIVLTTYATAVRDIVPLSAITCGRSWSMRRR